MPWPWPRPTCACERTYFRTPPRGPADPDLGVGGAAARVRWRVLCTLFGSARAPSPPSTAWRGSPGTHPARLSHLPPGFAVSVFPGGPIWVPTWPVSSPRGAEGRPQVCVELWARLKCMRAASSCWCRSKEHGPHAGCRDSGHGRATTQGRPWAPPALSGRLSRALCQSLQISVNCFIQEELGVGGSAGATDGFPQSLSVASREMGKVVPASHLLPGVSLIVEAFHSTLKGSDERHGWDERFLGPY